MRIVHWRGMSICLEQCVVTINWCTYSKECLNYCVRSNISLRVYWLLFTWNQDVSHKRINIQYKCHNTTLTATRQLQKPLQMDPWSIFHIFTLTNLSHKICDVVIYDDDGFTGATCLALLSFEGFVYPFLGFYGALHAFCALRQG